MVFLCAMRAVVTCGLLPSETLPRAPQSCDTRHEMLPSPRQRPLRTLPHHCRARLRIARRRLTLRVPEQLWNQAEAVPPLTPYGLGQHARRMSQADAFGLRALISDRLREGMAPGLPAGIGIWLMPVVPRRCLGETGCVEQHALHLVHIRAREFD